ncbi:glycosyltransferase family 39 protein [Luteibacter yeojuensis]|uniref:Glycosyltransferase family 39 protein n=1 Tax=Luteibacter yeojuensis TaxID=345309 RepID=A0A7X5QUQ5_9GAMM|nr:glycosyltransferase family 39 protein [Luteibacter yeojuensis]
MMYWKEAWAARLAWMLPLGVFLGLVLVHSDLPGVYMDAVNPDFLAAQWLHRGHNPGAGIPSKIFPILGSFYHGLQNAYLGLPFFAVTGFSVTSLRLEQAVFGLILLAALYQLTRRLTGAHGLALATGIGLATELAFTASFRTQFYIVLGGAAWLVVSMLLALPAEGGSWIVRRRVFWSGVFFGLASYGYFVLAFFAPAMAILVACWIPRRDWGRWVAGAVVGVSPFLLGFLSLLAKKHGVEPTLEFVRGMLGQLKPFDASGASGNNLQYAWALLGLATSDAANEAMIFGQGLPGAWGAMKAWWLVAAVAGLVAIGIVLVCRRQPQATMMILPGLMPISFVAVASLFGHRLWAHHFSVLLPFVYLLPALLAAKLAELARLPARPVPMAVVVALALAVIGGNLVQQARFHEWLAKTGGRGRSSDALTTLALEARGVPANVAYLFPEWGFFTSFAFLTGNRVRYSVDIEPATIAKLEKDGITEFRLVYWNAADEGRYRQALQANGIQSLEARTFPSREGQPVFHWLRGGLGGHP